MEQETQTEHFLGTISTSTSPSTNTSPSTTTTTTTTTTNVATRKSELARIQTDLINNNVKQFYANNPDRLDRLVGKSNTDIEFNVISMTTTGDQILDKALPDIASKSLFTKELEVALLEKKVDYIVHSSKDLPTTLPDGCVIPAIPKRDEREDCIVLKKSLRSKIKPLDIIFGHSQLPTQDGQRYRIGTSSQRRIAMLLRCNHQLECVNIRGNLKTRLDKLDNDDGEFAAIILAKAGLNRMGWSERASETLTPKNDSRLSHWYYAVGQGALATECRADDDYILDLLSPIVDLKTTYEVIAERIVSRELGGGCSVPLGVRTTWCDDEKTKLTLKAIVLSPDGTTVVQAQGQTTLSGPDDESFQIKPRSEMIKSCTGIVLHDRWNNGLVSANLDRCVKLGHEVAKKMIDLGCLELMRQNKK